MSEYNNYDDYYNPDEENGYDSIYATKKLTFGKIFKKTFVFLLKLLAVLVFALLFWRIFLTGETEFSKTFFWNETAVNEYTENKDNFSVFYYKRKDNLSNDGKFSASNVYYAPSIGQFQITIRYNNSTLEALAREYSLEKIPSGEVFVYTLSDNLGNTYTEYTTASDKKNMYNYRKVIFDGIDMNATKTETKDGKTSELKFEELYINVYYAEDVDLSKPYSKMTVYDSKYFHEPFDLSKYEAKVSSELKAPVSYTVKDKTEQPDENA